MRVRTPVREGSKSAFTRSRAAQHTPYVHPKRAPRGAKPNSALTKTPQTMRNDVHN